jgi:pyruvate/2-oxoglutarate dehydrogenase complex dihydrolipoamide acyltransferase (E2) component
MFRHTFAVLFLSLPLFAADPPKDWAFKPVSAPGDHRGGIDAFVVAKLEKAGLSLSPPADKTTLLRRVTFDLTGLPPTPTDLKAFLDDDSPTAYETVVDRLLKSPQFGERAALFWLDAVRYAESDGFKADDPRPNAWRYRDYVIDSFNADKPYDRFLKEQLAGDELFPGDPAAVVATGFLRHYPDEYNAVNCEQRRQEILNDITDTVGAAFLGVTLGCARCHDHKTDPIPQEDYYRLQAAFVGFKPVDVPLDAKAQAEYEAKRAAWEAKTSDLRAKMADLEQPYRVKAEAKERMRFQDEYAKLLDVPEEKCSPREKQIRAMVAAQVYSAKRVPAGSLTRGEDKDKWDDLAKQLAAFDADKPTLPPMAMAMSEVGPVPPDARLLRRGNWQKPGAKLDPGALSVIAVELATAKPTATTSGRRAALAEWVASKDNPLTARAAVNRVWQQHFGRGIAASSADLGATGELPTHPELLDWLAAELVAPSRSAVSPTRKRGTGDGQGERESSATPSPSPLTPLPPRERGTNPSPLTPNPSPAEGRGEQASISPRARRLAEQHALDWSTLRGSGRTGRIRERDVVAALPAGDLIPHTAVRRTTAARMVESRRQTAPVTLFATADATALVKLRADVPAAYTDFLLKLVAVALQQHPTLAARWTDAGLRLAPRLDIGLAVDTPAGLLVPVVRDVPSLSLTRITEQTRGLIDRARGGTLTAREMDGGCFTVSSLGAFGIGHFTPIINHPECAILGVGAIKRVPAFEGDRVVARDELPLSLTFDHRAVDGAPAARFLQAVSKLIEAPNPWV